MNKQLYSPIKIPFNLQRFSSQHPEQEQPMQLCNQIKQFLWSHTSFFTFNDLVRVLLTESLNSNF